MNNRESLLIGMALGAGFMYLLDPDRGRRRRSLLRDQIVHGGHELEDLSAGVTARGRHLRNRFRGAVLETRRRDNGDLVDDSILEARVRSRLGRLSANPSQIDVRAEHGRITLLGSAPLDEMRALVEGVEGVPGVHDVINRLEDRESAG
ncbi:MAG: BON domain-containing protein [Gemmatimonadota bacterium]